MKRTATQATLFCALMAGVFLAGCDSAPGHPGAGPEVVRPEEVADFATLYKTNCLACHGANGQHAASIALANPTYLSLAGEATLREVTAKGVRGKLMPAFARTDGGTLTGQQIEILARGMMEQWNRPALVLTADTPGYRATLTGDAARGVEAYGTFCASCHGAHGEGMVARINGREQKVGSIVDPSYLALISDQALRSFILAGVPNGEMPDWRKDAATPMTDQQITDVVAWLAAQRTQNPGQPYSQTAQNQPQELK